MSRARDFADLAGSADAGGITGRNLIINGSMTISQRGSTFADLANGGYGVDRFIIFHSDDGAVTVSQDTTVPAGQGFKNSMKFDVTTADTSIGAAQYYQFAQKIEGQNMAHLEWGTSNAKSVTLSFWIRSNLTGTYNVYFLNSAANRYHPVNFTIDSADTWEKKTITATGDTTGTWLTTNGIGMFVLWNLALGSNNLTGTNATWGSAGPGVSGTTQANFLSSTSNELYITGVQLEVGQKATPFEHRSYGDELARCQRYYYKIKPGSSASGYAVCNNNSATVTDCVVNFPVSMRANPTAVETTGTASDYRALATNSGGNTANITCNAVPTFVRGTVDSSFVRFNFASSSLTVGGSGVNQANTADSYLAWSSEL